MNKKIKILLVDDDEILRGTYAEVFSKEGFEVSEAVDGIEGLDKATSEIPDIIFTGIIMPRMDGFVFKDALSKNVNTAKIPVIMLSHMGREEDRLKAHEFGIKDFIVQGMISPRQIVEKINAMFGSGEYKLRVSPGDLDAPRLAGDLNISPNYKCAICQTPLYLSVKVGNNGSEEIVGKFLCANREDSQHKAA